MTAAETSQGAYKMVSHIKRGDDIVYSWHFPTLTVITNI